MEDINTILADVKQEGDKDPFATLETETLSESPAEKEPEKDALQEETPEENVPFHKHPRWIERENELKELREKDEATAKELEELKAFREETSRKLSGLEPSGTQIPEWFVELYGENDVAWTKYEAHEREKEAQIEQKVIARQEETRQKATQETERWNKWVNDEIETLKSEGKEFDRNELIKTMLDYRPTDENNNFDFKKGYTIYEALKGKVDTVKSQARKQLADTTTRSSPTEKKSKDFMTAAELRRTSWNQL